MSYAKYMEDNNKIRQERQAEYILYQDKTLRCEEYIPYAVRYKLHQPKQARQVKRKHSICS